MVTIASVDLSGHEELFEAISDGDIKKELTKYIYSPELRSEHVFYDKGSSTVWIQWYNERTMK